MAVAGHSPQQMRLLRFHSVRHGDRPEIRRAELAAGCRAIVERRPGGSGARRSPPPGDQTSAVRPPELGLLPASHYPVGCIVRMVSRRDSPMHRSSMVVGSIFTVPLLPAVPMQQVAVQGILVA